MRRVSPCLLEKQDYPLGCQPLDQLRRKETSKLWVRDRRDARLSGKCRSAPHTTMMSLCIADNFQNHSQQVVDSLYRFFPPAITLRK
mmetsp:Transcript_9160/g.33823  ORF Transcript_9160/g.33823 Transcript_9160/m.33823 type:complete len:87 (-) Transcript_9160:75-335(-)